MYIIMNIIIIIMMIIIIIIVTIIIIYNYTIIQLYTFGHVGMTCPNACPIYGNCKPWDF